MNTINIKKRIALLVDYDNFNQDEYFNILFEELEEMGEVIIGRVYFSNEEGKKLSDKFRKLGLDPTFQLRFSTGKNAVDIRMSIEAIELLSKDYIDGFCLATHDSDFTPLVKKLKEYNKYIIGAGRDNVSVHFKSACDHFINVEQIYNAKRPQVENKVSKDKQEIEKINKNISKRLKELVKLINEIIDQNEEGNHEMYLSSLSSNLYIKDKEFNPKNYGASNNKVLPFFQKQLKNYFKVTKDTKGWKVEKLIKSSNTSKNNLAMKEKAEKIIAEYIKKNNPGNIQKIREKLKKDIPGFTLRKIGHTKFLNLLKEFDYKVKDNTFSK